MVVALEVANDALLKEGILGDTAAVGSWRREAPMVAAVMMTGFDLDCPSWLFYGNITASRSSKVKVKVKKCGACFYSLQAENNLRFGATYFSDI